MSEAFGHHILLDLFDCQCSTELLRNLVEGKYLMKDLSKLINPLGQSEYQFEPYSYSIVLLLKESHLSIHTWTDDRFVACDFFTCNGQFLEEAVDLVIESFNPKKIARVDVERGNTQGVVTVHEIHRLTK